LEFPHQGEKPYRRHPGAGRGPVFFALKSISWENAWIPASAGMTKSLAIFTCFSHQRTLFHHPVRYLNLKSVLFLAKVLVTISAVNLFGSGRQKFRRFMLQGTLHCNALKNWGEG
jgi:hypothetical protein